MDLLEIPVNRKPVDHLRRNPLKLNHVSGGVPSDSEI